MTIGLPAPDPTPPRHRQCRAPPRIWAIGISRLSRAFADLIRGYAAQAEFRIVGKGYAAAAARRTRQRARAGRSMPWSRWLERRLPAPACRCARGAGQGDWLRCDERAGDGAAHLAEGGAGDARGYLSGGGRIRADFLAVHPGLPYLTEDDAAAVVKALKQEGVKVVVGPGMVTRPGGQDRPDRRVPVLRQFGAGRTERM
ncbi:hypothetical protein ACU4GD_38345 [Cupriavidus basilensis]